MKYAIYPPIGIGRVGNSPTEFYYGPETLGSEGFEIDAGGLEVPVSAFKELTDNEFRMKRQAARFTVFEFNDGRPPKPTTLPDGAKIRWTVSVANKKDAAERGASPLTNPSPVVVIPGRADRVIEARGSVAGPSGESVVLEGTYQSTSVQLGEIFTDGQSRLVCLGGIGRSESPSDPNSVIGSFYTNDGWFDDLCDGPIRAVIEEADGTQIEVAPAWVIMAPPDFAPPARPIVTLFDVIQQVAIDEGWIPALVRPNFEADIRPLIERAASHRHVHGSPLWESISTDWAVLGDPSADAASAREENGDRLKLAQQVLSGFELRRWQINAIDQWVRGDFDAGSAPELAVTEAMIRAALDAAIGQGFYPGIEAGINLTDPTIFHRGSPFDCRLNSSRLAPGDLTALMANPWQADFKKCSGGWWPAQRPSDVTLRDGSTAAWLRPPMSHNKLVDEVMRLGVVEQQSNGEVFEVSRDPGLGP